MDYSPDKDRAVSNLAAVAAASVYDGDGNNNTITGSSGNDTISGLGGDDTLAGAGGNDVMIGGTGNDNLRGDAGSDAYRYFHGDGSDSISDLSPSATDVDKLILMDLNAAQVELSRNGATLYVRDLTNDSVITVNDQFTSTTQKWGIEQIRFADGTTWNAAQILAKAVFRGTTGDDTINTESAGNDTIIGGKGNDSLRGNGGSDTYVYAHGDGSDSISDQSPSTTDVDTLQLTDLNAAQVELSRSGSTLYVRDITNDSVITVAYQFYSPTEGWGIEQLKFADGTAWNAAQILANAAFRGTTGNDTINTESAGNDTIIGSKGDDNLRGNGGSDTYVYSHGDGSDSISDQSPSTTDVDTLRLTDLNAAQVELSRSGSTLYIRDTTNDSVITVAYQFYSPTEGWGIEQLKFADGTAWDAAQILANAAFRGTTGNDWINTESAGNDTIIGGKGDDNLRGNGGSDTYVYAKGDGWDIISDQSPSKTDIDTLQLVDLNQSQVILSKVDTTLYVWDLVSGSATAVQYQTYSPDEYWGIEQIKFADSSTWNTTQMNAHFATMGTVNDDLMPGTAGADKLAGGTGNDTYTVNNSGDIILEYLDQGLDTVKTSLTYQLTANVENLVLTGSAAIKGTGNGLDNALTGNSGANLLDGGAGNDTLNGGAGIDTMIGGDGNDTFVIDTVAELTGGHIVDSSGSDTIKTGLLLASSDYVAGIENYVYTGSQAWTFDVSTKTGVSHALTGGSGADKLTGSDGSDRLDGGAGGDTMTGGNGNDTYIVGSSSDVVKETSYKGGSHDLVMSSTSYTLNANVEDLTLTGSGATRGTGNELANIIIGNDGQNLIIGGLGKDTLTGGLGSDTFKYGKVAEGGDGETIRDFVVGPGGDVLNLHDLLVGIGTDAAHAVSDGYLLFETKGANTVVKIDVDGAGGPGAATTLVTLTNAHLEATDSANLTL